MMMMMKMMIDLLTNSMLLAEDAGLNTTWQRVMGKTD